MSRQSISDHISAAYYDRFLEKNLPRKGQIERLLSESERLLDKVNGYFKIERLLMEKPG